MRSEKREAKCDLVVKGNEVGREGVIDGRTGRIVSVIMWKNEVRFFLVFLYL